MKNIINVLKVFLVSCVLAVNAYAYDASEEITCNTTYLNSESSATFQATWNAVTWDVVYNIDGASGTAPSNQNCEYDQPCVAATQGDLLKTNAVFGGWNMTCSVTGGSCADFTSRTIAGGTNITNVTTSDNATITLTAVWNTCNACNPTNATCSLEVVNNTCVYTTMCLVGYQNIQNDGQYNPICTAKTISLTYVDEDGTTPVAPETGTCTYGTDFNLPAEPVRQGYIFAGWELVVE